MHRERRISIMISLFFCQLLVLLSFKGAPTNAQAPAELGCSVLTAADLGSTTALSTDGLISSVLSSGGEGGGNPVQVRISQYRILCDASGSMRNTSSYVSVLVEFVCSSAVTICDGSTMITRQYQFSCGAGNAWTDSIFGSDTNVQTTAPTATFMTTPNDQCRVCADDEQINNDALDNTTHCFPCSASATVTCNQGQMRCFVNGSNGDACCNFYFDNACVAECPAGYVSDSNFDCVVSTPTNAPSVCSLLTLTNGNVAYSNGVSVGSIATHTCLSGYRLSPVGGEMRTCTASGWDGQDVSCNAEGGGGLGVGPIVGIVIGILVFLILVIILVIVIVVVVKHQQDRRDKV